MVFCMYKFCLYFCSAPIPPSRPSPPNDSEIAPAVEPEDPTIIVTLSWEPPDLPGGELIQYVVNLIALSGRNETNNRQRRQTDDFLEFCIVGDNNVDRNINVAANETSLTVNDASMSSHNY